MMSSKLINHKQRGMNMIKLLSALIMMFAFGTSIVNAEEEATDIKDRISELAETKSASQSIINAEVDKLSEDELKTVIANVNDLTEPTEDDLIIKEAAISKLEKMKNVEDSSIKLTTDSNVEASYDSNVERAYLLGVGIIIGLVLVIVEKLLKKL